MKILLIEDGDRIAEPYTRSLALRFLRRTRSTQTLNITLYKRERSRAIAIS